jgi:CPA1 family monovalent cation:H+ antiporter
VLFTATAVAFAAQSLIGLPLAAGFILGAIVSPPDAVAASAIAERFGLPHRIVMILEGESLVNDATGLVIYKFGIAAVMAGSFSLMQASVQFVVVALAGAAIGLAVGWVSKEAFKRLHDNATLITLSLLVPYVSYLASEQLHVSGVLAAVTTGLYLGWHAPKMLTASARLEATTVWTMLVFLLNSIIFLLIGLQLPGVWANLSRYSVSTLIKYAAAMLLVVILVRALWVFPGAYLPRWLSRRVRETEPNPTWRNVLIVAWSGMRGIVSLAAAMALPIKTKGDQPFPGRDLIIFITFAVILGTLVGQGLTLPALIRWLGIKPDPREDKRETRIRLALAEAAQSRLAELAQEPRLPEASLNAVRVMYESRVRHLNDEQAQILGWSTQLEELVATRRLRRATLTAERQKLIELRDQGEVDDKLLQELQHELDLEEAKI